MDEITDRQAKISLVIDVAKAFQQIESIQKKLDQLSMSNLTATDSKGGLTEYANKMQSSVAKLKKTEEDFKSTAKRLAEAKKELDKAFQEHLDSGTTESFNNLSSAKGSYAKAKLEYDNFKAIQDASDLQKSQARANKNNQAEIKQYQQLVKQKLEEKKRLEADAAKQLSQEQKAMDAALTYQNQTKTKFASGSNNQDVLFSYQKQMSAIEQQAMSLYRAIQGTNDVVKKKEMSAELANLQTKFNALNKESVEFRKTFGIQSSRGFYDLGHSADYFFAKMRSHLAWTAASLVQDAIIQAPQKLVDTLAEFESNMKNIGQVLPDSFVNNQANMNKLASDFIKIAKDYGSSVTDIIEAGRLWGRAYKDVNVIQALVRSSTMLSITDNMSLTETNKALEATMQQYNITLKDQYDAQERSMKIVDSWAKLADNAVVTAQDLAKANEQSASAAYQSGVSFDFLQGMIATMAANTGKSGAEVGRAIRSMLISMRTDKAIKQIEAFGVAMYKVNADGTKSMRNMEDVITELMTKTQTTETDINKLLSSVSGGKFQYNNVSALIGGYDKLIENINTSLNSKGWAENQAQYQMDAITRQIAALKAEAMELINILNQAGTTGAVKDMVTMMTNLVEVLQRIKPETLAMIGNFTMLIFKIKLCLLVFRSLITAVDSVGTLFTGLRRQLTLLAYAFDGVSLAQKKAFALSGIATGLLRWTNAIGVLLTVFSALAVAYDIYGNQKQKETEQTNDLADAADKEHATAQRNLENMQAREKQLERLRTALQEYISDSKDENLSQEQRNKADEKIIKTKEAIIDALGKEAKERLDAAGWTEEAINSEIEAFNAKTEAQNEAVKATIASQIEATSAVIENTKERIKNYANEVAALQALADAQSVTKEPETEAEKTEANAKSLFGGGLYDVYSIYKSYKNKYDLSKYDASKTGLVNEQAKLADQQAKLLKLQQDYDNYGKKTEWNKTIGDDDSTGGGSSGSGSANYAEQLTRNVLLAKKNQLMYDAKTAMTEYDTALKKLNNDEEINGKTYENQIAKIKLFDNRINELDGTKDKYKQFLSDLQAELDAKIAESPDLMELTGYDPTAADDVKQRVIEINKETFQQVKTLSTIYNLMDNIKSKMAEIDNQQESINKNKNSMYIKTDSSSVYEQMLKEKSASYNRIVNAMYSPTNYDYDNQKIKAELQYRYDLQNEYANRIKQLEADLTQYGKDQNMQEYQNTKNTLDQLYLTEQENINKIKDLEYDKVKVIKEGLSEVAVDFLVQGNSLKDIWKNLWKDLAREAIQRMLQIKAQASVLGSLFGIFGGSGGGTIGSGMTEGMTVAGGTYTLSHGGEDISGYPKMHDGGAVNYGRVGVVPKLKNDEVVRTLQVGEEVNSIKDRRSNELMAGIIMKQMEETAKQPTMVNINALDSKSFAEYLNENSDILAAVLAKNKAMNR